MIRIDYAPGDLIGCTKRGKPIYLIAGGAPDGDDNQDGGAPMSGNIHKNLQDIERRQVSIRSELARLDDLPDPTEEDLMWQGTLIKEYDDLETRGAPLRQRKADLERVRTAATKPENNEGDKKPEGDKTSKRFGVRDVVVQPDGVDPFADLQSVSRGLVARGDLYTRAMKAIEQDNKRDELADDAAEVVASRLNQRSQLGAGVAKHILMTGSEEYREVFDEYLRDPNSNYQRAALSLTNANGGFLLPYVLDPTIILTNASSANPYRRISRTVQTTSNAWQGVNSAGVNAAMLAEAAMASDNSPTVGQIQIFPEKAAAWIYGSYEAMEDEDFARQLPMMISDAKDRLEEAQFTTGAGHGSQAPLGILAALGSGQRVAPATTGTLAAADVYAVNAALPPRFRRPGSANWLSNISIINKIRGIDTAGGSSFWANFGQDQPEQLLGKGIFEESTFATGGTGSGSTGTGSANLLFGDFNQFIVVDRVGVSMLYEPMVKGSSATASGSPGFPTGQAGWFAFWRFSSGVSTTNAFRYVTFA